MKELEVGVGGKKSWLRLAVARMIERISTVSHLRSSLVLGVDKELNRGSIFFFFFFSPPSLSLQSSPPPAVSMLSHTHPQLLSPACLPLS